MLHYGPLGGSKYGEAVLNYRYGLPDESWPEPDPHDPYSLIDKVGAKFLHMFTNLEAAEFFGGRRVLSSHRNRNSHIVL